MPCYRLLKIHVPCPLYPWLEEEAKREGFSSVEDYIVSLIRNLHLAKMLSKAEHAITSPERRGYTRTSEDVPVE